jgi:DNA polymerase III delta prime subunit
VKIDEAGIEALVVLGRGDMRSTLNHLQQAHLLSSGISTRTNGENIIRSETVYECYGHPNFTDITELLDILLDTSIDLNTMFHRADKLRSDKGLSLTYAVREIHDRIMSDSGCDGRIDICGKMNIVIDLADLEHRLSKGTREPLQLGALCASFARHRRPLAGQH